MMFQPLSGLAVSWEGCWHCRAALHLWGGSCAPLCGFLPCGQRSFLTGLDLCPLYCETAAAPFAQSHCKHRPGITGRSRACWRGGGRREPRDISSCLGSATDSSRGSRAGFALLICCCRTLLAAASSSAGLGLIHGGVFCLSAAVEESPPQ